MVILRGSGMILLCATLLAACGQDAAEQPAAVEPAAQPTAQPGKADNYGIKPAPPTKKPPVKGGNYGILPSPPNVEAEGAIGLAKAIRFSVPLDKITAMIGAGATIDEQGPEGRTPLISLAGQVCEEGRPCYSDADRLAIAKLLVDKGANVNHKTPRLLTPLQAAIDEQHWSLVEYLKSKGAKLAPELLAETSLEQYIEKAKQKAAKKDEIPDWLKAEKKPPAKR